MNEVFTPPDVSSRLRAEALRPDREKLLAVAEAVKEIQLPDVSADARLPREEVSNALLDVIQTIYNIAESMK